MTPASIKRLRLAVVLFAVVLAGLVFATLRRPVPRDAPGSTPAPLTPGTGSRTGELVWVSYKEGRESFRVEAREMIGSQKEELRLRGVKATFGYSAQGEAGRGRILADACRYTPALSRAVYRGNVSLSTEDGFELKTDVLHYRGDRETAHSDAPLTFSRKGLEGSATGLRYEAREGRVELLADTRIVVGPERSTPTRIRSGRAVMEKGRESMRFLDGVTATRGGDTLSAGSALVYFDRAGGRLRRVQAFGRALLRMPAGGAASAMAAPEIEGTRELRGSQLDVWFRPDGSMHEINAGPGARLLSRPAAGGEQRRLQARILTLRLDGQGRIYEIQGQKQSSFVVEPASGKQGPSQQVRSRRMKVHIEAASGRVETIDFWRNVSFERAQGMATAGRARYNGPAGVLELWKSPALEDRDGRARLTAGRIELATRRGDVSAEGDIVHTWQADSERPALFGGGAQPVLISSRRLSHDAARRSTVYDEQALLRSGADEVRAARLEIVENEAGERRLTAEGQVATRVQQLGSRGEPGPLLEGTAGSMLYDQARARIEYRQDVVLRRGDLVTRSPRAELELSPEGRGLERLVAGEPAEVASGERTASGTRATYTPASELLFVEGDDVRLSGAGTEVRCRALTFDIGEDRISCHGREQTRPTTIFRQEPPRP